MLSPMSSGSVVEFLGKDPRLAPNINTRLQYRKRLREATVQRRSESTNSALAWEMVPQGRCAARFSDPLGLVCMSIGGLL